MSAVAKFHLGDIINVFRHGSLAMQNVGDTKSTFTSGCIYYGTVSGACGLITQISLNVFNFLKELEKRLDHTIKSAGKIDHGSWRSFKNDQKNEHCEGFIDGDLIHSFLDLDREKMIECSAGLQVRIDIIHSNSNLSFVII